MTSWQLASSTSPPLQGMKLSLYSAANPHFDYLFKVLLVGDSGTGKSSILLRFTDDSFSESFISTIGVDFKIRTIEIDGKLVKLLIWDSAGQERFRTLTTTYYRGAHGILIVFDVCDRASFTSVGAWLNEIEQNASENVIKVIVGNKTDKPGREVEQEAAMRLADGLGLDYVETSAKTNLNVNALFVRLATRLKDKLGYTEIETVDPDRTILSESRSITDAERNYRCCRW